MIKTIDMFAHEPLEEMARIGNVGNYEICIFTRDNGSIPHFHMWQIGDKEKFNTCICITEAKYFKHGSKQSTLNASMRKALDTFLRSNHHMMKVTNYEYIVAAWNDNNPDGVQISEGIEQPDYTKLS